MKLNLSSFVALRYLRSKRTLNIVNLVSQISFVGVVCGTAALIIVLSVFNGFENLTGSIYSAFDPELKITPTEGKTFVIDSAKLAKISSCSEVENVVFTLDENVLLKYKNQQTISLMRGISSNYETNTPVGNFMYIGNFKTHINDYPAMVLGYGVAAKLGIYNLINEEPVLVYVPRREGNVSLNNPAKSLVSMDLLTAGIFAIEKNFDENYTFAPLEFVQELLDRQSQASAMEIKLKAGVDSETVAKKIAEIVPEMQTKTRFQQNETLYRMMKSEKLMVYAILILIVIILSFNISGSLSMLITEKKDDIATLKNLGASDKLIKQIFLSVGLYITILGIAVGLFIGLTFCFLQQYFGLLRLPGNNMLVNAYPVQIILLDVFTVIASVFVIGYFASFISVSRTVSK